MWASIYFDPSWHQPQPDFSLALMAASSLCASQQLVSNTVVKIDKAWISPTSNTKAFDWLWWAIYIIVISVQFKKHDLKFASNHYPFPLLGCQCLACTVPLKLVCVIQLFDQLQISGVIFLWVGRKRGLPSNKHGCASTILNTSTSV